MYCKKCGKRTRRNFPFGKKSKARTNGHDKKCKTKMRGENNEP